MTKQLRTAGNFCAAPGEPFSFDDEFGTHWEGPCVRLIPQGDTVQVDGVVLSGDQPFVEQSVSINYNITSQVAEIVTT